MTRARLRPALRARAAHRGLDARRPPLRARRRGRRDRRRACRRRRRRLLAVRRPRRPRAGAARPTRSTCSPDPGRGVTVIKLDDGRPRDRLHRRRQEPLVGSRPRRARRARAHAAQVRSRARAAARASEMFAQGRRCKLVPRRRVHAAARSRRTRRGAAEGGTEWRERKLHRRGHPGPRGPRAGAQAPGMYIGGIDARGYHHLLWEIVDNSIDEVINGYATTHRGHARTRTARRVTVEDDGRGIPVDMHPEVQEDRRSS